LYNLSPVDPQLESAWFQPLGVYEVKTWFQSLPFQIQLVLYATVLRDQVADRDTQITRLFEERTAMNTNAAASQRRVNAALQRSQQHADAGAGAGQRLVTPQKGLTPQGAGITEEGHHRRVLEWEIPSVAASPPQAPPPPRRSPHRSPLPPPPPPIPSPAPLPLQPLEPEEPEELEPDPEELALMYQHEQQQQQRQRQQHTRGMLTSPDPAPPAWPAHDYYGGHHGMDVDEDARGSDVGVSAVHRSARARSRSRTPGSVAAALLGTRSPAHSPTDSSVLSSPDEESRGGGGGGGGSGGGMRQPAASAAVVVVPEAHEPDYHAEDAAAWAADLAIATPVDISSLGSGGGGVRLYARVRPVTPSQDGAGAKTVLEDTRGDAETTLEVVMQRGAVPFRQSFSFDRVFWSHDDAHARWASDRVVASAVAGPMAAAARAGYDSTLAVVGATGGGKTWTADAVIAALAARLCLVASGGNENDNATAVTVSVSMYETRGLVVDDLLAGFGGAAGLRVRPRPDSSSGGALQVESS
jgi:hypothetical protein